VSRERKNVASARNSGVPRPESDYRFLSSSRLTVYKTPRNATLFPLCSERGSGFLIISARNDSMTDLRFTGY
jgi:hypothetical protein